MNKLNLTLRESLIIIFPGFLFSSLLLITIKKHLELGFLESDFLITVFSVLIGSILYSSNLAKKMSYFKNATGSERAKKHFGENIENARVEFFKFYDSVEVSEEFKSKENIYTSLYHMFFNSSILILLLVLVTLVLNIVSLQKDWHLFIFQVIVLFLCTLNTYLIFQNKVEKSFNRVANQFIKFKEKELGYV